MRRLEFLAKHPGHRVTRLEKRETASRQNYLKELDTTCALTKPVFIGYPL